MKEWLELRLVGFFVGWILGYFIWPIFLSLNIFREHQVGSELKLFVPLILGICGALFWKQFLGLLGMVLNFK